MSALEQSAEGALILTLVTGDGFKAAVAEYIARETAKGRLKTDDPAMAAEHFLGLLVGHSYMRRLLGLEPPPDAALLERRIKQGVAAFLRAYAERQPSPTTAGFG